MDSGIRELEERAGEAVRVMKALSNEGRLLVLCNLVETERSVSELEQLLGYSQPQVSQILARLRHEGYVACTRQGRSVRYRIADPRVREILEALHGAFCSVPSAGKGDAPALRPAQAGVTSAGMPPRPEEDRVTEAERKSVEERKAQLLALKREILSKVRHIEEELNVPVDRDDDEAAIEMEDDEVLEELEEVELRELHAIEAALERIRKGEYGFCRRCGREIEEERLDAVPWTPFCAECAREVEAEHRRP